MNDDLVQPSRGFGAHPHRDTEICTYIIEGNLSHKGEELSRFYSIHECVYGNIFVFINTSM
jgi:hypothetical protein